MGADSWPRKRQKAHHVAGDSSGSNIAGALSDLIIHDISEGVTNLRSLGLSSLGVKSTVFDCHQCFVFVHIPRVGESTVRSDDGRAGRICPRDKSSASGARDTVTITNVALRGETHVS